MSVVILILKSLCVVAGAFLIIARLFIFERTQGAIQSKIEDLWVRIDDYEQLALFKHTGFMQTVARLLTKALDRLFGVRLISLRSLTISICYGFATFFIAVLILLRYSTGAWDGDVSFFVFVYLLSGSIPLGLSFISDEQDRRVWFAVWLTSCVAAALHNIIKPFYDIVQTIYDSPVRYLTWFIVGIGASIVFALLLYTAFLVLMRLSLRTIATSTSWMKTSLVSLLNIAPIFTFYALLKLLTYRFNNSVYLNSPREVMGEEGLKALWASWSARVDMLVFLLLMMVFLFDIVFLFTALLFGTLSLLLLLHRLLWPVLSRLVYATQRFAVIRRGNVLFYLGALLIALGLGGFSWLKALVHIP